MKTAIGQKGEKRKEPSA